MRYSSQNLSDGRRAKFWNGRAWLHLGPQPRDRTIHWEWSFGRFARDFSATVSIGTDDSDDGILFHLCIPWVFSVFVGMNGVLRCRESKCGIQIHNGGVWVHFLSFVMESATKEDPWYRHYWHFEFPWNLTWYSTEILVHEPNTNGSKVVWRETEKNRKPFLETYEHRRSVEESVSKDYPYAYILKNRTIQNRTATVFVSRMRWRARWWPLIPKSKTSTTIDVKFDQEVGEETGSWKGGCTGCSYEMKYGESPERCLSRMEHEREFGR